MTTSGGAARDAVGDRTGSHASQNVAPFTSSIVHTGVLFNLQALRAVAALFVVTHHLDKVLEPAALDPRVYFPGNTGVDLFFVISGFVMVYTTARRPLSGTAFALNRVIRVVPLYWAFTLLLGITCMVRPELFKTMRTNVGEIVQSLLFVPHLNLSGVLYPTLFVGWTLNYEMFFYLLFALALAGFRPALGRVVVAVTIVMVALVAAGLLFQPSSIAGRVYSDPIMLEFAMGMALAHAHLRGLHLPPRLAWLVLCAGFVVLMGMAWQFPAGERVVLAGLPSVAIVAAALALERRGRVLDGRGIQLLGGASYALYLVHPFVNMVVGTASVRWNGVAMAWVLAGVAIVGSIAAAVLTHLVFERPVTGWLRRRSARFV